MRRASVACGALDNEADDQVHVEVAVKDDDNVKVKVKVNAYVSGRIPALRRPEVRLPVAARG